MPDDKIKTAFERNARTLSLRPALGQGTARTVVRLTDDLTCEVEDGAWSLVADMSEKHGGGGKGPNPGILGRAAVGTCLAISYRLWSAKLGIPLDQVEVKIEADYDTRGIYGVDDVDPGYSELRYVVAVESSASEEEIIELLDTADRHSPWLSDMRRPIPVKRDARIAASAE